MPKLVKAQLLTAKAFRPFGRLIEKPSREADVGRDYLDWWGGLYDLAFEDTASLGYLEIRRRKFEIDALERHVKAVEVFIPIDGVSIMPFAPAGDLDDPAAKPDASRLTAFIVDGTQGLVIERGVWHFPPFPLTERMAFILTVRKDTADDLDIKSVAKTGIEL